MQERIVRVEVLLPPMLGFLARAASARPGAVPALAARRLARTAEEHRPAAVLLVAGIAIGTTASPSERFWRMWVSRGGT